jgi:hypothetical protein
MEPEARIHTYNILKKEEMHFMYALGAKATPPPQRFRTFYPRSTLFTASFMLFWLLGLEMPLVPAV